MGNWEEDEGADSDRLGGVGDLVVYLSAETSRPESA